jgi:serine phosphatase RsbU (regulator of sigma subunit)/catechol 2,3-dioxygenase-like lactoylglutathione lyase family enzyme
MLDSPVLLADENAPLAHQQRPYLRLHHVTVFVRDQDRSLRFYVEQLGFSVLVDYRFGERGRFILLSPPDGTAFVALVAPRPESDEYKLIGRPGQAVFVTDDIAAAFDLWRSRGVRFQHAPKGESWGGTFTSFEDLDGNTFALVGYDDMTREVEARRRLATEKLAAERRTAQELEIAKQVQAKLFPQRAPTVETLDYAGICIQARAVGGDYYDFLQLGRERLALVVGDISGKGIAAALLMANLQANLRHCAMSSDPPERFLRYLNDVLHENTIASAYATLFFAEYDNAARSLRYVNCGHVTGFLIRSDRRVERLDSTCTVLGLFRDWDCTVDERQLFPGDTLVLYTDGMTEAFDLAGEEFGEERLIDSTVRYYDLPAQSLVSAIVNEVRQFSRPDQHDDITLIVAKCREHAEGAVGS